MAFLQIKLYEPYELVRAFSLMIERMIEMMTLLAFGLKQVYDKSNFSKKKNIQAVMNYMYVPITHTRRAHAPTYMFVTDGVILL